MSNVAIAVSYKDFYCKSAGLAPSNMRYAKAPSNSPNAWHWWRMVEASI